MLDVLIMIVAVILIILSLLQGGKSSGASGAFSGGTGGLNLFSNVKERGPEKMLANLTMVAGFVLMALVLIYNISRIM